MDILLNSIINHLKDTNILTFLVFYLVYRLERMIDRFEQKIEELIIVKKND